MVFYEIVASVDGKPVASLNGRIRIEGAPRDATDEATGDGADVQLTDKSPTHWIFKEAKVGTRILSDRDYLFSALPDEVKGGTLLLRVSYNDSQSWLKPGTLRVNKDTTVYSLILWKQLGKEVLNEVARTKLVREGWKEVDGATVTTFPNGEDWRWITLKKEIKKGDVILQLRTLSWNRVTVLFVFK